MSCKIALVGISYLLAGPLWEGPPPIARELGRCQGVFQLDRARPALSKPSAISVYDLPPKGERQTAWASLAPDFDDASLRPYGWMVTHVYKGFAALEGNAASFALLSDVPGILEVKLPRKVRGTMDATRQLSRIDGVLNWGPAPNTAGLNGKGCLVGLVDFGFDTHHPAFLDTAGKTRFLAIWDPNLPKEKNAPFGMGQVRYQSQLQADPTFGQHETDLHGTHVGSVAAGSNRNNNYYGAAPEADLIGVNLSTKNDTSDLETNVAYGIEWIFHVADSLKLPCVINLSLGNQHVGPHDGTSQFDRFLDSIIAPGHIIVGAAGNDGDKKVHGTFNLGATDTLGSFTALPAVFDLWGETGKTFKFQVMLVDSASGNYTVSSVYIATSGVAKTVLDTVLWTNPNTKKSVSLIVNYAKENSNPFNRRPHVELVVLPTGKDSASDMAGLMAGFRLVGAGLVNTWSANGGPFMSLGIKGFKDGDNDLSISEIGGTSKSIISVGAYVSKNVIVDYSGVSHSDLVNQKVGELAVWSSHGPTLDGRIKPEFCAPGRIIVAALSSAVTQPYQWQLPAIAIWPNPSTNFGRYMAVEGTSQAAPVATGVIALMLEANPKLTSAQAKQYLMQTAYQDANTGTLASPNSLWGAGKLDASAAIQKVKPTPVRTLAERAASTRRVAAFFAQGNLWVTGMGDEALLSGTVCDWRGRTVSGLTPEGKGRMGFSASLRSGVYFATVRTNKSVYRLRWFKT